MSLKWKLSLLTSVLSLAAVAGFSAVLLWTERRSLEEVQARRQKEAAAGLAEVCRSALVNEQDLPLANYLKRLALDGDVFEALCADAGGRVAGHTDPTLLNTRADAAERAGVRSVRVEAPVTVGQRSLGTARILYDHDALNARLEGTLAETRRRIRNASLLVGGTGFLLAFLVTALAVRPVRTLVEGVRALAAGRLDHQITLGRRDELGWLAEEFNRMAERLSELDRMKADFVNGITHDLKSPLTAIKASADNLAAFLQKPGDPGPARESVSIVRRNADRLMGLIVSILDVARIEDGLSLDKSPVDLEGLADRVLGVFRPEALRKGLAIDLVAESPLPPFPADESKLERVLSNLIGNAVKFTEKGGVTVAVGRKGKDAVLSVRDTGPGIPAEFRARLFTKFSRAETPGRRTEGSGLGLAISKGFVEAHGGDISVESAPGAGTTFTMRIPLP